MSSWERVHRIRQVLGDDETRKAVKAAIIEKRRRRKLSWAPWRAFSRLEKAAIRNSKLGS